MRRPRRALNALALMLPEAVYDDFSGRMKAYMDEADQRIAELEAENAHLLKTVNLCYRFQSERRERIVELEEGLQEYGRHKSGCGYFDPEVLDCTCGLTALKEDA